MMTDITARREEEAYRRLVMRERVVEPESHGIGTVLIEVAPTCGTTRTG